MMTIRELKREITNSLTKAGVNSPAFDALCLIEKVFDVTRSQLIIIENQPALHEKAEEVRALAQKRINGTPLQYLLGQWEFYGYTFKVGEGVLIPRDDTEVVLSFALEFLKGKTQGKILDLCSGSGALAVAIQKETGLDVVAVEKSEKALSYLNENVKLNNANVKVFQGDVFTCMDEFENNSFDLIISNPPYIKTDEIKTLQKEVQLEPKMALDGGLDGYDFYNHIVNNWTCKLKNGGALAFELGEGQFDTVKQLMTNKNYKDIEYKLDFGNIKRAIKGIC